MIIDGHSHACGEFSDPDKIIALMDKFGIDKTILCPGLRKNTKKDRFPTPSWLMNKKNTIFFLNKIIRMANYITESSGALDERNKLVHHFIKKYPNRLIQFYWTNPLRENIMDELNEKYSAWKFGGIKLHQCAEAFKNDSIQMDQIASFAGQKKLPIFIHPYSKNEVKKIIPLAEKHRNTNFIIAHLIGLELIHKSIGNLQNIFFDISPYYLTSKKRIRLAIEYFGAEHLIFGSDTPYGKKCLERNLKRIKDFPIPESQKKMILGNNLQHLLRL